RLRSLFALALVMSTCSAVADSRDDEIRLDACSSVASTILLGRTVTSETAANVELCNAHGQCLNFKHFIEENGKAMPSLTCPKGATAAPVRPELFRGVFQSACALAAQGILKIKISSNLSDLIALCNRRPDKQSCVDTKDFIEAHNNGDAGGLTCE